MADTDIRIKQVDVEFSLESFRTPLQLSTGPIYGCDYAAVTVLAENRSGRTAEGRGGVFLSNSWCFPGTALSHDDKADCMRTVVRKLAALLEAVDGFHDPLQVAHRLERELDRVLKETEREKGYAVGIPRLLGVVCWSPLDAAVHDAWGQAAGRSCYEMYDRTCLNEDLSLFLGPEWKGRYPGEFLAPAGHKTDVWVQHVVGVNDPLTDADVAASGRPDDDLPVTLTEWIGRERIRRFKIKLKGDDVDASLAFIRSVHRVAAEQMERGGVPAGLMKLALDPNEAFRSPEPVVELLAKLRETDPACFDRLEYIEQPTPRDLSQFGFSMADVAASKPVIMDESLDRIDSLELSERYGWSGIALKTCKGQSDALAAYCWGIKNGKHVTVQDLTHVGLAFVHSAHLWGRLRLSADSLEYNSRQFAPFSFPELKRQYPSLFQVKDGKISLAHMRGVGLY